MRSCECDCEVCEEMESKIIVLKMRMDQMEKKKQCIIL